MGDVFNPFWKSLPRKLSIETFLKGPLYVPYTSPLERTRLLRDKLRQLFGQNGSFRQGGHRGDAEPRSSKHPQIFESVL